MSSAGRVWWTAERKGMIRDLALIVLVWVLVASAALAVFPKTRNAFAGIVMGWSGGLFVIAVFAVLVLLDVPYVVRVRLGSLVWFGTMISALLAIRRVRGAQLTDRDTIGVLFGYTVVSVPPWALFVFLGSVAVIGSTR